MLIRVGSPKRAILQTNELEVELQVEAGMLTAVQLLTRVIKMDPPTGNSTSEPSAGEVVQQFTQGQQQTFNTELSNTPGAPPDTTLESKI